MRLIGVDTPEVFGGAECFGREASALTKRLLSRERFLRYRLGVEPRDRYGRALAYVWLEDGSLVNGLLVERGYATVLTIAPNVELAGRFRAAARRARAARRGLWACTGAVGDAPAPADGELSSGRGDDGPSDRGGDPPSRGDRDCSHFRTREAAQAYFRDRGGAPGRDPEHLDGDGDGDACESLP